MADLDLALDSAFEESEPKTPSLDPPNRSADSPKRKLFVLLQSFVLIVLCYQVLFSERSFLNAEDKPFVVVGLMLFMLGVFFVPARIWERTWPVVGLVLGDTVITIAVFYLSGNTGSALYVFYFLVMLITAFGPTPKQMIGLSVALCATYGVMLYVDSQQSGALSQGHLLGLTVLLATAIFYGSMTETLRKERQKQADLREQITTLKRIEEELKTQSGVDWLTGLANRRRFDEVFQQEWGRARRDATPLSLLMIDIDHFKTFNDTYGHQAGDDCLRQVARAIGESAKRHGDVAARYGGEEFVIVLPKTDAKNAVVVAETMRAKIEATRISHDGSQIPERVTISLGVAAMTPTQDTEPFALITFADQALYQAKRDGRNRVISTGDMVRGPSQDPRAEVREQGGAPGRT